MDVNGHKSPLACCDIVSEASPKETPCLRIMKAPKASKVKAPSRPIAKEQHLGRTATDPGRQSLLADNPRVINTPVEYAANRSREESISSDMSNLVSRPCTSLDHIANPDINVTNNQTVKRNHIPVAGVGANFLERIQCYDMLGSSIPIRNPLPTQ